MKTFVDISTGLNFWNAYTNNATTRAAANSILGVLVEFNLASIPSLDSSDSPVNVYVGYDQTYLFLVMIQQSKDITSRYSSDLAGVMSDMAVVQANLRTGVITNVVNSPLIANQITNAEALARTTAFASASNRLDIMNDLHYGPIFFEVPKANFLKAGNKKAIFGIKPVKVRKVTVDSFDFIIENWEDGNEANKIYLDVSVSIPPLKPSGSYGLYKYLEYDFS